MGLGGETRLLVDGCFGCKEDETPFIRESESEVKGGGNDGQDSDTTEILSDCDEELIDKMPTNIEECQVLSSDAVKLTSPGEVGCKSAASSSLDNKVARTSENIRAIMVSRLRACLQDIQLTEEPAIGDGEIINACLALISCNYPV